MTAKEYLCQIRQLNNKIKSDKEQLDTLRRMVTSIAGPDYDSIKVDHSPSGDAPFEKVLIRAMDLETEIDREIEALIDLKGEAAMAIAMIDYPLHQRVLTERYIACKNWPEIADALGYTKDGVFKMHRKALQEIRVPEGPDLVKFLPYQEN